MDWRRATKARLYLGTVFGRRLFGLFVLCALGPTLLLSAVSGWEVTQELEDQEEERLHHAARAAGMLVVERLTLLSARLREADERPKGLERDTRLRERLSAAGWQAAGECRLAWGESACPEALSPEQQAWISRGEPQLVQRSGGLALLVPTERDRVVWGQLNEDWLFDISHENALPPHAEFCVIDANGRPLRCSLPGAAIAPEIPGAERLFDWQRQEREYLAYHWSLFLGASFGHPSWVIALAEPKDVIFAPIARFRWDLAAVTFLALFTAALVTAAQLRRSLVPLDRLREGTQRLARGEFDQTVNVRPGDELADLAASFNGMASQLGDQFDALGQVLEIDREILAALDEDGLADTLVQQVNRLVACDTSSLVLLGNDGPAELREWTSEDGLKERQLIERIPDEVCAAIAAIERSATPDPAMVRSVTSAADVPDESCDRILLPLLDGRELLGAVMLSHGSSIDASEARLMHLRRVVDQAAVALASARIRAENRFLSHYDQATGLPNRFLFQERLDQALARTGDAPVAVAILFLGGLGRIRDTLGREAADGVLAGAVVRLQVEVENGSLARLGAAEFAILDRSSRAADAVARRMNRLVEAAGAPITTDDGELSLDPRIGVAMAPQDGLHADGLMRDAGAALRLAEGPARVSFFSASVGEAARESLRLEGELRRAIEQDELRVYYQPVVRTDTRELVGAEALVRWQHPERGVVEPDRFIPVAESSRLVIPLTNWVLQTACRHNKAWRDRHLPAIRVAVNLSAVHVREPNLIADLYKAIDASGLDASALGVELTESLLLEGDDKVRDTLASIRRMGVRISLDDFGTGYSSFGYLRDFPIDTLKIDRRFLAGVPEESSDVAIARSIIAMSRGLGLGIVAEGVENERQLAFLRDEGCELAQGYLFSEPMPEDEFEKFLAEWDGGDGAA